MWDYFSQCLTLSQTHGISFRVRQTLFDWLAPVIEGVRCLDLFAGSGALWLGALSRGAAQVTFVETGAHRVELIRAALATLGATSRSDVRNDSAIGFLASPVAARGCSDKDAAGPFDIVFLDPPFDSELLGATLAALPRVLPKLGQPL